MARAQQLTSVAAEVGLGILAVGIPVALGGVHRPVIALANLIAAATVVCVWHYRRSTGRGMSVPFLGVVLMGATAWTALQLLPVPLSLLEVIAPATAEVLKVSLAGHPSMPRVHAISLDPGATLWALVQLSTCTLAFIAAYNHLKKQTRRRHIFAALAATGAGLAIVGLVGAVAAPGQPLFFYRPESGGASGLVTASFVNPNHGAAYFVLCALSALGLVLSVRDTQKRLLLAFAAILMGTAVFLTLSRGGILSFALGLAVFAGLLGWNRSSVGHKRSLVLIAGCAAVVLALTGWLAYDLVVQEFEHILPGQPLDFSKTDIWPAALVMIAKNAFVGVGRGAFESAFTRYLDHAAPHNIRFTHLENEYLQLPAEWGLFVGFGVLAAVCVVTVAWIWKNRGDVENTAVGAALIALAAHNLVDFNLEILGVALPVVIVLGGLGGAAARAQKQASAKQSSDKETQQKTDEVSVIDEAKDDMATDGVPATKHRTRTGKRSRSRTNLALAFTTCAMTAGFVAAALHIPSIADDTIALDQLSSSKTPFETYRQAALDAMQRHPAEYSFHVRLARQALLANKGETIQWLNRARSLYPNSPLVHLEAAQALQHFGHRRQALLEINLALKMGAPARQLLDWGLRISKTNTDVAALVPRRAKQQVLAAELLLEQKRFSLAQRIVAQAKRMWPQRSNVSEIAVKMQLALGNGTAALAAAKRHLRKHPHPLAHVLLARATEQAKGAQPATKVLIAARKRYPDDLQIAEQLALTHLRAGNYEASTQIAHELLARCRDAHQAAKSHDILSKIYAARGRMHRAQYEAEVAHRLRANP